MTVVTKDAVAPLGDDPLNYVMSDETVDRYGDIIKADGWKLDHFKKNPIALFGHDPKFIVGHWTNIRIEGGKLLGRLELLKAGVSERLDEIRAAVEAGVLRAVSVGFRAMEKEPLEKTGGYRFTRQELVECSLVSIPANPNALQVMRSLHLSDHAIRTVLGESAEEGLGIVRRQSGESAASPPHRKTPGTMNKPLSERVLDAQNEVVRLKDILTELTAKDDLDGILITETSDKIEKAETDLASLKRAEQHLAIRGEVLPAEQRTAAVTEPRRPFAMPAQKIEPKQYAYRAATVQLLSHIQRRNPDDVRYERYGDDEVTKAVVDSLVVRAASAPATTTTSGWASQLVQTVNADFMQDLMPASVYPSLSARGLRLNFGRNGVISIPSRSATPTIAGSFVGEGSPIPVRQGAFTSTTLTPKKLAVISTFTREIAQHSTPAIEGLIRNAIQEDTSVAVDSVLLDATAASSVRPAGLRNGVTVTTATAGADFDALVTDIKNLVGALITATNGNVRNPVWIMNPVQAIAISLTQNAGGDFPFQQEINGNRLQGFPVIVSSSMTAGMIVLLDAADFVSVEGDAPMFDVSDQATLHMEDTTPLAIGTTGTPTVVAAPVRSLFQTDTIAIRMIMPMNWALRRSGVLAWTQSVTW
jgi:HK97 family phage major capsid protein/HK97 family phage prohead protease